MPSRHLHFNTLPHAPHSSRWPSSCPTDTLCSFCPRYQGFPQPHPLGWLPLCLLGSAAMPPCRKAFLRSLCCTAPQPHSSFFLLSFSSHPRADEVCVAPRPLLIYHLPPYWKCGSRTEVAMLCSMLVRYLWVIEMSRAWNKKGELRNKKLAEQMKNGRYLSYYL